jgi:hypothetical protein
MLLPMCIGLYQQFGVNGLRFYFWEQSFGRITGENRWVDDSTFLFFTHELPWQVLPWVVFVLAGIGLSLKDLFGARTAAEHASTIGASLVFVALSLSQFKLPHYLYVTLPLFSIMGAQALHKVSGGPLVIAHYIVLGLLWTLGFALTWVVFPDGSWPFLIASILLPLLAIPYIRRVGSIQALVPVSFALIILVGAIMNGHFYPRLLNYQANAKIGQWAAERNLPKDCFFGMQVSGTALDHYAGYPVQWLSNAEEAGQAIAQGTVIYTNAAGRAELLDAGLVPLKETRSTNYPVQLLGLDFLLPAQRETAIEDRYVLEF